MRRILAAGALLITGIVSTAPAARAQNAVIVREMTVLLAELNYQLHLAGTLEERLLLANSIQLLQSAALNTVASSMSAGPITDTTASAMSCPIFVGSGTMLGEDSCLWSKTTGQWSSQFSTDSTAYGLRMGGQTELSPGWFLGGALSTAISWQQSGDATTSGRGQSAAGSVAVKRVLGPVMLSGAAGFSATWNRLTRQAVGPASGQAVQADMNVYVAGLRLRGAYDFAFDGWYVRPRFDVAMNYMTVPAFTEAGPAGATFSYAGGDRFSAELGPVVEVGGRFDLGERTVLRLYVAGGPLFLPDNTWRIVASFTGPLAGFGSFSQTFVGPSVLGVVEAGLQLYDSYGIDVRAEYKLATGYGVLGQTASLRLGWRF